MKEKINGESSMERERSLAYKLSREAIVDNKSNEISVEELANIAGGASNVSCRATGDSTQGIDWVCDLN